MAEKVKQVLYLGNIFKADYLKPEKGIASFEPVDKKFSQKEEGFIEIRRIDEYLGKTGNIGITEKSIANTIRGKNIPCLKGNSGGASYELSVKKSGLPRKTRLFLKAKNNEAYTNVLGALLEIYLPKTA